MQQSTPGPQAADESQRQAEELALQGRMERIGYKLLVLSGKGGVILPCQEDPDNYPGQGQQCLDDADLEPRQDRDDDDYQNRYIQPVHRLPATSNFPPIVLPVVQGVNGI